METTIKTKKIGIKDLFQFRAYIFMLIANSISRLGDSIDTVAYGWMVYTLTSSKLLMGTLFAVNAIPNIIFSPFSGVIIDRISKKKAVIVCNIGRGFIVSLTAILFYFGALKTYHLFIFTIINLTFESFVTPASAGMFSMILPKDYYLSGNSFSTSVVSFSELLGYAISGVILSTIGISGALLIDGTTFFLASFIIIFIKLNNDLPKTTKLTTKNYFSELKEGFCFIKKNTLILITILLASLTNFGLSPINSLQAVFVKDTLKSGPEMLSFLDIAVMVGTILGGILVGQFGSNFKTSTLVILGFFTFGISYAMLYIPGNINVIIPPNMFAIIVFFMLGLCIPIMISPVTSYIFSNTPKDILVRVISVLSMVTMCAVPLGSAITGFLSEYISLSIIFLSMGILISFVSLTLIFNKNFRKI